MASLVVNEDPDQAIAMINEIPEGQQLNNARLVIAYSWASQKPDQVEEIIETLNLGEADAEQIRQISQRAYGIEFSIESGRR